MSRLSFQAAVVPVPSARARLFILQGQHLCVEQVDGVPVVPSAEVPRDGSAWLYFGQLGAEACYARALAAGEPPPAGCELVNMRALFGVLDELSFGVAGRAMTLLEWDLNHRFCGRCGKVTARSVEDRSRLCAPCKLAQYPRLSPAVIALVEHEGRALLARNKNFPLPFFSCLAGFVEPGESLEETVVREIHEEVGLLVKDVEYFGSQPWPFTHSLMIGFRATYASGELALDEKEIQEARWFSVDELPSLPSKISISRRLIDDFISRRGGAPRD
jgi:NAD+ diphosphatase